MLKKNFLKKRNREKFLSLPLHEHAPKQGHGKTPDKVAVRKPGRECSPEMESASTLNLNLQPPDLSVVKANPPPPSVMFCYNSPSQPRQRCSQGAPHRVTHPAPQGLLGDQRKLPGGGGPRLRSGDGGREENSDGRGKAVSSKYVLERCGALFGG